VTSQSGAATKGNTGSDNQSVTLPGWAQQLPKEVLRDQAAAAKLAAFKTVGDLAQGFLDASGKAAVPAMNAAPEEVEAFYESLGKPKTEAGYNFARNEPVFAKAAFQANLTRAQAEALYQQSQAQLQDAQRKVQAQVQNDLSASDAMLKKEYADKYDEAVALFGRGLGNNAEKNTLSPLGQALMRAGLLGKPEIVHAFIELGRATSEGRGPGKGSRNPKTMPKSVFEGRSFEYPT
jgi:hypothetical protein